MEVSATKNKNDFLIQLRSMVNLSEFQLNR
jgi:hypothetical protein